MRRAPYLISLLLLLSLSACDSGVSWDQGERDNARHIFQSLEHARKGAQLANRLPAGWEPDSDAVQPVIQALDDALIHAAQVRQSVLIKAHPNLNARFRTDYLRSLRQLRDYYKTGDYDTAEHPGRKLGDFTEWFYQNQHEFRWWRGYQDDVGLN